MQRPGTWALFYFIKEAMIMAMTAVELLNMNEKNEQVRVMEFHEVANIFPLMIGDEFRALVEDIRQNGLIEPIWTYQGKIIDGRNRYRACIEAGVEPKYQEWSGEGLLVAFVVGLNLNRRHLTSSQKAVIAVEMLPFLEADAKERQGIRNDCTSVKKLTDVKQESQRATAEAAKLTGTNRQYVSDAKKLKKDAPEILERVKVGTINMQEAKKVAQLSPEKQDGVIKRVQAGDFKNIDQAVRAEVRQERIEKIVAGNKALDGDKKYNVILADPPWRYDHPISDSRIIENQYPTMTLEDICALPVADITADEAIIFLWATTPMLKKALQVLEAWGFNFASSMVWVKPSIGPGYWVRQRHEFLLVGIRGSIPTPVNKPDSVIEAPRTGHSQKPEMVYGLIEMMYPELSKVELFARQSAAPGWAVWGNEVDVAS
jgi:N6-adenosine-specific RNA methylase IME4